MVIIDFLDDPEFENEFDDDNLEICGVTTDVKHVNLDFQRLSAKESEVRSLEFYRLMDKRRTVRFFSPEPVPVEIIHNIVKAAGRKDLWRLGSHLITSESFFYFLV